MENISLLVLHKMILSWVDFIATNWMKHFILHLFCFFQEEKLVRLAHRLGSLDKIVDPFPNAPKQQELKWNCEERQELRASADLR